MFKKRGIKLHIIISLLILFIIISTVAITWLISTHNNKTALTESHLDSNYNYAKKLTNSLENQLAYMQKNVIAIGEIAGHSTLQQEDLDTWYTANKDQFNSIFITDNQGTIQLLSPSSITYDKGTISQGTTLTTDAVKNALSEQKPMISEPYYSTINQLIMLISAPIIDKQTGEYRGMVGGTIYLESENVLKSILGTHEYDDHSYVYVVDQNGLLIYHPNSERLGDDVSENNVVKKVMDRESGSQIITNTVGNEFFAGYAYSDSAGWGIVAQTPTSIVNESLTNLFWRMVLLSIPFLFIILLVGGVLVSTITKPLNKLADFSEKAMQEENKLSDIELLNIHSPIYEVRQLYFQVIDHLRTLNREAKMDGLTEIANRRTFNIVVDVWMAENISFSLIMLDIDHFKKVNDTHGHLTGDQVLKFLAEEMVRMFNKDDLCFRYGGEEFGILVKNKDANQSYELAEKLRLKIANTICPTGKFITVSLGVTDFQDTDEASSMIIKRADEALYESKKTGRNQTTLYQNT